MNAQHLNAMASELGKAISQNVPGIRYCIMLTLDVQGGQPGREVNALAHNELPEDRETLAHRLRSAADAVVRSKS